MPELPGPPRRRSRSAPARRPGCALLPATLLAAALAGCAVTTGPAQPPAGLGPTQARALVEQLLPARTPDRAGWAADVQAALASLGVPSTPSHLCAVLAVAEQESGFQADPPVPGLPAIAWREIERRAGEAGVPMLAVRAALALPSPDGRSYADRLDGVKTERQLSVLFEDFIGMVPLGRRFLASRNPVRTGGPMQVSIAFAEQQAEPLHYPYPVDGSIRHEVFTRRGGLWFGAAHLLAYDAPYDRLLYRFADFNAGRWASRNAAFQQALSVASGLPVTPDGDLLPADPDAPPGETERAARVLAARLGIADGALRRELARGDGAGFERSTLWQRVFEYAERLDGRPLPRAVVPRIELHSPKITRRLTTAWFAERVDERHRRCLARADGG